MRTSFYIVTAAMSAGLLTLACSGGCARPEGSVSTSNRESVDATHLCYPAFSPDGSRIAVAFGAVPTKIAVIDRAGRLVSRVSLPRGDHAWPWFSQSPWSPNGQNILLCVSHFAQSPEALRSDRVCVVDASTGAVTTLCESQGLLASARWFPDGAYVVFEQVLPCHDLWTVPATGGRPTRVTTSGDVATYAWDVVPPGGERIVFARHDGDKRVHRGIWSVAIDGSGLLCLNGEHEARGPLRCSPIGRLFASYVRPPDLENDLYLVSTDEAEPPVAIARGLTPRALTWSSDGLRLAFMKGHELMLYSIADQALHSLTGPPRCQAADPSFDPMGKMVAFTEDSCRLWAYDLDASRLDLLLHLASGG